MNVSKVRLTPLRLLSRGVSFDSPSENSAINTLSCSYALKLIITQLSPSALFPLPRALSKQTWPT